jgi:hypothetical protein
LDTAYNDASAAHPSALRDAALSLVKEGLMAQDRGRRSYSRFVLVRFHTLMMNAELH